MLHFLAGNDPYLLSQKRHALQAAFLKDCPDGEVRVYDFEDQRGEKEVGRVMEESEAGLFGGQKLLILFQSSLLGESALAELLSHIEGHPEAQWILVEPGAPKKTGPLAKWLKGHPHTAHLAQVPEAGGMRQLLKERLATLQAEGKGVRFSPEAEALFLERVGTDTGRLFTELEKLALFQGEANLTPEVTPETVRLLLKPEAEDRAFQGLDALSRGERKQALLLFREALEAKESALPLLGLCAWQMRQLLLVREAYGQGIRQPGSVSQQTGVSPFVAGKLLRIIERFPLERSRKALKLLSEYDHEIKQGYLDPETAVDLYVWKA